MRRRLVRWMVRALLGLLALTIVAIIAAIVILHSDWGREKVRAEVEAALQPYFPAGARVGRVEGSLLGDFVLRDIVLQDLEGRPAIRIARVEVNVAFLALLRDELRLEKAIVEGSEVDLHQVDARAPNLATMYEPSPEPLRFDMVVERLEIRTAQVMYERDGRVEHLDDFTVLGRLRMKKDGALAGRVDVTAAWRERQAPIGFVADAAIDATGVVDLHKAELVAGDVHVEATELHIGEGNDIAGALRVESPHGALPPLFPELGLTPAAIELDAALLPIGNDGMRAVLRGRYGASTFLGALSGRREGPRVSVGGTLMVRGADARDVIATLPATSVDSSTVVALQIDTDAGLRGVYGTIGVDGTGTVDAVRFDRITAGVMFTGGEASLVAQARGDGETWARASGIVTVTQTARGRAVDLHDGIVVAHSTSLERAAQGRIPIAGTLDAELVLDGRVVGEPGEAPRIAVRGTIGGQRLRRADVRVRDLAVALDLAGIPTRPAGSARVSLRGVYHGPDAIPDLDASARGRLDGGFALDVRAEDRARDARGRVTAMLTLPRRGDIIAALDLESFDIDAKSARVTGRGGRIVIGEEQILVRGLRGHPAGGTIAIDAVAPRARPTAVSGVLTAERVDLKKLRGIPGMSPAAQGLLDGRITVERGHARAHLTLADDTIGDAAGIVDVVLPRRLEDPAAWLALDRRAIRELQLDLRAIDLAELSKALGLDTPVQGRIDGAIRVGTASPIASIHARGVLTEDMPAPADIDLNLDLDHPTLAGVDAMVTLRNLGTVRAQASMHTPLRVFDLAAWRRLGIGAIESVRVQVDQLVIDERLAVRADLPDLRGVVSADLRAGRALARFDGTIVARDLRAARLVEPATVTLDLDGERGGLRGNLTATLAGTPVVTATLFTPRDLVAMINTGRGVAFVPVTGTLAIVDLDIQRFGRAFGVDRAPTGTMRGTGELTGTIGAPTGNVAITIEHLGARRPRRGGALRDGIERLAVNAAFAGGQLHVTANGTQGRAGQLGLVADVRIDALDAAEAHLVTRQLELRPFARVAPDLLFGLSGTMDADLRLRGTDPAKATLRGSLAIRDGTLPIDDTVGILRNTNVDLTFAPAHMTAVIKGTVGAGTLSIEADAALDGLRPRRGTLVADAKGLELITSSAPRVTGRLTATIKRDGDTYNITAAVRNASVTSRVTRGRVLHPSGMPDDLVFASTAPGAPAPVPPARRVTDFIGDPPTRPFANIILRVYAVAVDVPRLRGDVAGRLDITIGDDGAIIDGKLEIQRGDVMVLERRYRLRRAIVSFDGGLDPLLDLQLERELPELTLIANIRGRASDPQLEFQSDPPTYTQGQLLAFALSDTASAAGSETTDAASNLFASVASQAIVGAISPILPVRFDLIAYEPASASSSRAFVFGRWITRRLLVLYRNRAEARPDENVNEAEVEYWLGRRVLVEGVAGDRGILGADLLWTRRW